MFFWNSCFCFFNDPTDIGNLISDSSAFLKSSLNICKFSVQVLLKSGLENFEHYFASVWDECNCALVWIFFVFLWYWNFELEVIFCIFLRIVLIFPGGSDGKASAYSAGDLGSIPGSGRSPGEGNGNLLQYSCLENPMDRRTWLAYRSWGRKESDTTEQLHSLKDSFEVKH